MEDGAEVEDGRGGAGQGVHFFLFLAELHPTFNPTLYNPTKKGFLFWGEVFATSEVGLEKVGFEVGLGVVLWSFLAILPPILPQSYPNLT
jgi:hypothetical protein